MDPREQALALFRDVAKTVPAYRDFLAVRGIEPDTVTDLATLPLLTKANYTRCYPLPQLCRDGVIGDIIAVSSGSSGEPSFWPRSAADERAVAARFEQVFRDAFGAHERRTLAVVCFALGTWVGGLFTLACVRELASRGFPITAIAPGSDAAEILRVIPALAPLYDQVVLLGYPPFLKGVIDRGRAEGVPWERYDMKLVTAGEVFSEQWRSLVCERVGAADPARSVASLYGTADAGVLGNETPLSIELRRFFAGDPAAARELFGESRLPTLVQYDPLHRWFEAVDGTLVFSGDSGVPLIRYHIADDGGVIPHDRMLEFVAAKGFTPSVTTPELPFVYVFGRSMFTVSYFGANVFPENIAIGLEQPDVAGSLTGKFVMQVVEDEDRDSHLHIAVELAGGATASDDLLDRVGAAMLAQLLRLHSEFAHYVPRDRQRPVVELRPLGDPELFPPGGKHRYTRR